MKPYHKNPRTITTKRFDALAETLDELGDLSPIVHNLETDEVISGNQRMRVFDLNACKIVLTAELDQPASQGTVATGYVEWRDSRYAYRAVRWDERTAERANITANKAGGAWNWDILANEFEIEDLLDWGFSEIELQLDALANDEATASNGQDGDAGDNGYYGLIVECDSESARTGLLTRLTEEGYECRAIVVTAGGSGSNTSTGLDVVEIQWAQPND